MQQQRWMLFDEQHYAVEREGETWWKLNFEGYRDPSDYTYVLADLQLNPNQQLNNVNQQLSNVNQKEQKIPM